MSTIFLQVRRHKFSERKAQRCILTGLTDFFEACHILQQCCIIIAVSQLGCKLICNGNTACLRLRGCRCRKSINNNTATTMLFRFFQQTSVLALPWWQRVLLVAPVCLLLWFGVMWALGGD